MLKNSAMACSNYLQHYTLKKDRKNLETHIGQQQVNAYSSFEKQASANPNTPTLNTIINNKFH